MALITKYPLNPDHAKLYRGDPWATAYRVIDGTDPDDPDTWEPRDLTGTFWRAHIRDTEDGTLLAKWTVEIEGDQSNPDEKGWLLLTCPASDTRLPVLNVKWDLEQVSDANDDADTESLGTVWKVKGARIEPDVSWVAEVGS